jgi:nicotinamide riboside kinase
MRINFFGGPGAGKSTTTARVFASLKERGVSVEHVGEYVKAWAYQKRVIQKWDQIYLFGKQQQYEYRYISTGVKNIVTDSPCFLSVIYTLKYQTDETSLLAGALADLSDEYDRDHPCLNIFLNRGVKPYVQEGRYQDYKAAQDIDKFSKDILKLYNKPFVEIDYLDHGKILDTVIKAVEK